MRNESEVSEPIFSLYVDIRSVFITGEPGFFRSPIPHPLFKRVLMNEKGPVCFFSMERFENFNEHTGLLKMLLAGATAEKFVFKDDLTLPHIPADARVLTNRSSFIDSDKRTQLALKPDFENMEIGEVAMDQFERAQEKIKKWLLIRSEIAGPKIKLSLDFDDTMVLWNKEPGKHNEGKINTHLAKKMAQLLVTYGADHFQLAILTARKKDEQFWPEVQAQCMVNFLDAFIKEIDDEGLQYVTGDADRAAFQATTSGLKNNICCLNDPFRKETKLAFSVIDNQTNKLVNERTVYSPLFVNCSDEEIKKHEDDIVESLKKSGYREDQLTCTISTYFGEFKGTVLLEDFKLDGMPVIHVDDNFSQLQSIKKCCNPDIVSLQVFDERNAEGARLVIIEKPPQSAKPTVIASCQAAPALSL